MRNTNYIQIPEKEIENLEQFIRGSLLGDGCISKLGKGSKNNRITFAHCSKQLDYLKWKQSFLNKIELGSEKITKVIAKSIRYKNGECVSFYTKSKTHPIFTRFREMYYTNTKEINKTDIIKLNEFGLAIWYMDDGNLWKRKKRSDCITLNTTGFSKEDVIFLINFLYDKWQFICTYNKSDNTIRISTNSCKKFLFLIEPFKINCMAYKWVHVKLGELGEKPEMVNTELSQNLNDSEKCNA